MFPIWTLFFSSMSDSSATRKAVRKCSSCPRRMSNIDLDGHDICSVCRGKECSFSDRCEICSKWSDDRMHAFLNHMKGLERKRLHKQKRESKKANDDVYECLYRSTG